MNADPRRLDPVEDPSPRRLYLHEPGWRIGHKLGSEREFCYMMSPGQNFYHRLSDGEIYLQRGDGEERLCVACAQRRGLLSFAAKGLREPLGTIVFEVEGSAIELRTGLADEAD